MDKNALFIDAFRKPICPEKQVIARAKKLIPHYAAWNKAKEAFFCTACGKEVPLEEILLNKHGVCPSCGTTVQFVQNRWVGDALWIYVPDAGRASYWHVIQNIHENGEYSLTVREEARYVIPANGKKIYWTRYFGETEWKARKNPHFVQYNMYLERKDWCERCYVIPSQFQTILEKVAPEIRTLGFNAHRPYGDDTRDLWFDILNDIDKDIAALSDARKNAIRTLAENGCEDVARYLFFNTDAYWEKPGDSLNHHPAVNVNGKTLQEILLLDDLKFKEYMATDKSYDAFTKIAYAESLPLPGNVRPIPEFRAECRASAESLMRKEGLNLHKVYVCPDTKGKHLYLRYTAENVKGRMHLKEQILYLTEKGLLLKGHAMLLKPNFDVKSAETSVNVFNHLVPLSVVPRQARKHFVGSKMLRTALIEQPEKALVWEKLKTAGYKTLAKEFFNHLKHHEAFAWKPLDTSSGDLNAFMGVPPRFMVTIDKQNATIEDVQHMQAAYNVSPSITVEDYMLYHLMYPSDMMGKWILDNDQTIHETIRYLSKMYSRSKIVITEYKRYLENLHFLYKGQKITRKQAFPDDFEKTQLDVSDQVQLEKDKDLAAAMRKISEALRADRTITRFFQKDAKYLVLVPESPAELRTEGKKLHNCLRTYVKDVAEGNTSVFFIRRADAPDMPFVAMQYSNGRIVQIRSNMNRDVDDDVRDYANKFVKVLNKVKYDPHTALQVVA